ncbi:MAG: LD-carboxypeptidase, partial [Gammaproteobacteria bacterium]
MTKPTLKPPALSPGDTVMLFTPGHQTNTKQLQFAIERIESLGLEVLVPDSVLDQYGYFAGTAEARADEIHKGFADPKVKALIAVRGGSGSSLLLSKLDYELIRRHPKIIMGMSDVTALLIAINEQTGLTTFHGPVAGLPWPRFTSDYVKAVLFAGEAVTMKNPPADEDDLTATKNRVTVINAGTTTGTLIGGNATVLCAMMGSSYLPQSWQ